MARFPAVPGVVTGQPAGASVVTIVVELTTENRGTFQGGGSTFAVWGVPKFDAPTVHAEHVGSVVTTLGTHAAVRLVQPVDVRITFGSIFSPTTQQCLASGETFTAIPVLIRSTTQGAWANLRFPVRWFTPLVFGGADAEKSVTAPSTGASLFKTGQTKSATVHDSFGGVVTAFGEVSHTMWNFRAAQSQRIVRFGHHVAGAVLSLSGAPFLSLGRVRAKIHGMRIVAGSRNFVSGRASMRRGRIFFAGFEGPISAMGQAVSIPVNRHLQSSKLSRFGGLSVRRL